MKGLILIAHGSKRSLSNNEFLDLVSEVENKDKKFAKIEAAFLEFATPNINTVVKTFIENGIREIYFYPYFLNSGKHVSVDLPNIINKLKEDYPLMEFRLLSHFGKSNKISNIIIEDISSYLKDGES